MAGADKQTMSMTPFIVFLTFTVAILYIMRRRVRLGRRKASF
jgi:hypothetical protein